MDAEEHKARHVALHRALDELVADCIRHNPTKSFSTMTVLELMEWSASQLEDPTPTPD